MDLECVAYTTPKGSDEVLLSSPVSIRLAIQEGWFTKAGSKWQTMPKQMLMYRAASWWTSIYAPELSMGMKTVEESQDIEDVDFQVVDVADRVAEEKAKKANKIPMEMNMADPDQKEETPEKVEAPKTTVEPVQQHVQQQMPGF